MPRLDRYQQDVMDNDEYSDISQGDRAAAEQEMRDRDRDEGKRRGDLDLLYGTFPPETIVDEELNMCFLPSN